MNDQLTPTAVTRESLPAEYGIEEHRHRFSMWAAARAAQRGFTDVNRLRTALESSGVREFLRTCNLDAIDTVGFDALHRAWCRAIVASLIHGGVEKVTFGRAAKLVAVYMKSVVVIGIGCGSRLSSVAHPPIDGILLSAASRSPSVISGYKADWARVRWTTLDEESYYRLIGQLRAVLAPGEPFWMLERFWTVTDE